MTYRKHRVWTSVHVAQVLLLTTSSACSSPVNTAAGTGATSSMPAAVGGGSAGVTSNPAAAGGSAPAAGVAAPTPISPASVTGQSGSKATTGRGAAGASPVVSGTSGSAMGSAGIAATAGSSAQTAGTSAIIAGAGGGAMAGAAAGRSGAGGTGMTAGNGACPHVSLKGTDICTIGDSWIQIPGNQVTTLENHMRMAGVISANDHFDRREVSGSTLPAIINTYNNKPANCKILVMDGGGIDLFTTPAGNQAAIAPVVQKFKDFLQKVKTDGYVQHIIYSLYPVIPSTPNLNTNMKPGFSEACAASAVDCHLVDLEPLFKGQHIGGDRTHADNPGGVIIGDAWWKAMQENCIAQ